MGTQAGAPARHPAKYSDTLIPIFARLLAGRRRILDPFAGTGRIFELEPLLPGAEIDGVEIEEEWSRLHPKTTLGNALRLPWPAATFDAICTSPCYGNRMADHHNARDKSRRNTYRHALGRALHRDNAGQLQWGEAYRSFHYFAWKEAKRVLQPGGLFVLNISDHIRAGQVVEVSRWHVWALQELGFTQVAWERVETPRNRQGANGNLRVPYENVIALQLEEDQL